LRAARLPALRIASLPAWLTTSLLATADALAAGLATGLLPAGLLATADALAARLSVSLAARLSVGLAAGLSVGLFGGFAGLTIAGSRRRFRLLGGLVGRIGRRVSIGVADGRFDLAGQIRTEHVRDLVLARGPEVRDRLDAGVAEFLGTGVADAPDVGQFLDPPVGDGRPSAAVVGTSPFVS
jgi:hypothetical protein